MLEGCEVSREAPHAVLRRLYKDVYTLAEALILLVDGTPAETVLRGRLATHHPSPDFTALLNCTFVVFVEERPEVPWGLDFSTCRSQDLVSPNLHDWGGWHGPPENTKIASGGHNTESPRKAAL